MVLHTYKKYRVDSGFTSVALTNRGHYFLMTNPGFIGTDLMILVKQHTKFDPNFTHRLKIHYCISLGVKTISMVVL